MAVETPVTVRETSKAGLPLTGGAKEKRSKKIVAAKASTGVSVLAKVTARAETDGDFLRLLDLIADAPARPAGDTIPFAAHAVNGSRRRVLHDDFKAHSLTTEAARKLLGAARAQNLHTARQRRRLIGRTFGNVTYLPAWQFDGGAVRADLARIIELLGHYADDAVVADRLMRLPREDLDGRSIIDALGAPRWAPTAWVVLADSSR